MTLTSVYGEVVIIIYCTGGSRLRDSKLNSRHLIAFLQISSMSSIARYGVIRFSDSRPRRLLFYCPSTTRRLSSSYTDAGALSPLIFTEIPQDALFFARNSNEKYTYSNYRLTYICSAVLVLYELYFFVNQHCPLLLAKILAFTVTYCVRRVFR